MQLSSQDETDLLTALHQGAFEQPLWQTFLERVRGRTKADYASLIFRPLDQPLDSVVELFAGCRPVADMRRLYATQSRLLREGRVYTLDEMLEGGAVHRAQPGDVASMRMVRVSEASGVDAWLAIASANPFGPRAGAILSALAPHLRIALQNFIALERERFRSDLANDAIARLNFGWITLDAQCRIVDLDANAERVLERTSLLGRGRYGRLAVASPGDDRALSALVRRFAESPGSRPRAISLSRDPWLDMLVSPVQQRSISSARTPVAIAYLNGDRRSTADRCEQLAELFGLTASEARLAWAMAQGMSIAEAAGEVGLTIETARNYSKKIYAKAGARGQPELVRNILLSVLALA